jgi:hypothetical protein
VRKIAAVALLVILIVATFAAPALAWSRGGGHGGFHGRGVVVIGTGCCWGWGWGPWWSYPPYYAPYYAYAPPPVVEEPPVYVERSERPEPPESYWYYCPSTKAYYPSAPSCSEAWIKVPPRPAQ